MLSPIFQIIWLHSGAVKDENYGNFLQRVWKPCSLWQDDPLINVTECSVHAPEALEFSLHCDLLVIIQCEIHWLWDVIQRRKLAGLATLYEINDDIASFGDWLPATHPLKSPLTRQQLLNLAHHCDAVLFSSYELARYYEVLHPRRLVVDPWVEVPHIATVKKEGFVIGWGGSATHLDDLLWIAPELARFLNNYPEASFSLKGSPSKLAAFVNALPPEQVTCSPFGNEADYFEFLQSLHVGIAPLKDTRFNRCRSDGKFVQYAINGCVSLLSDLPPFSAHREKAILFESPESMYIGLEQLYHNRPAMRMQADTAQQWVKEHRSPKAVKYRLRSIFSMFLPTQSKTANHKLTPWVEEKRKTWWQIHEAINQKNHEQSIELCRTLQNEYGDLPQVRWLLIRSLLATGRKEQALDAALEPTDNTFWANEFSALAYGITPSSDTGLKALLLTKVQSPLKRLRLQGLPPNDLEGYFRRMLEWLPYDYFALFGLIKILQKHRPEADELKILRERARLMTPENSQ